MSRARARKLVSSPCLSAYFEREGYSAFTISSCSLKLTTHYYHTAGSARRTQIPVIRHPRQDSRKPRLVLPLPSYHVEYHEWERLHVGAPVACVINPSPTIVLTTTMKNNTDCTIVGTIPVQLKLLRRRSHFKGLGQSVLSQ